MRKRLLIIPLLAVSLLCGCAQNYTEYTKTVFAMDTVMDLKIYSENEDALSMAEDEIRRIDSLLDRGNAESEIYKINSDKSASVSAETAQILSAALSVSERTHGAFDITIAPVMDLWGFYGGNFRVPSEGEISSALEGVGYEKILLDENSISIPYNSSIDLGGIGKGYASDRVISLLKENGVSSAIISLGGNVHTLGSRPNGSGWTVGIQSPDDTSLILGTLTVRDKAVVTSGGYRRFFEENGKFYHHIIDPKTGKSAESGLSSVTIVSDSGTLADALSTALFVMGLDESIALWSDSGDFDAVLVTSDGEIYITEGLSGIFECDTDYSVIKKQTAD